MPAAADVHVFPDLDGLTQAAAQRFVQDAHEAIGARGRFAIVLAGGATPQPLYRRLARPECTGRLDWSKIHVFWGDERSVPPDDERSNYRMARDAWLDHIAMPEENVHRMLGEAEPHAAASKYDDELRAFFHDSGRESEIHATFDLVLLGLGEDGHTASLFPHTPAIAEQDRWVCAQYVPSASMWRITLTPAAINRARDVLFLVAGARKAWRVKDVLEGPRVPEALPAQAIRPRDGRLSWFLDRSAGAHLRVGKSPTAPPPGPPNRRDSP